MTSYGLLHSDICGSKSVCDSPQLFAAYHVFRRLLMPRHSPCALLSLTLCLNWFSFEFQIELRIINVLSIRQYCSLLPINLILKVLFLNISSQFLYFFFVQFSRCYLQQPHVKLLIVILMKLDFIPSAACKGTQVEEKRTNSQNLVGSNGLEPSTSRLSGVRSNHLSYEPSR